MYFVRSLRWPIFIACCCFLSSGCQSRSLKITGKITKGGQPFIVQEGTYVTLSFVRQADGENDKNATSTSANFDPKSGSFSIELPPGKYKTSLMIAYPSKNEGELNAPKPIHMEPVYDLTKDQELTIELPTKS